MNQPLFTLAKSVPAHLGTEKWYHRMLCSMLLFSLVLTANGCQNVSLSDTLPETSSTQTAQYSAEVALKWGAHTLRLIQTTPGFSPPVASRAIGYAGLTLYESVVHGMPQHRSMLGQLNGLSTMPIPQKQPYDWAIVANAAQAHILRNLFSNTSLSNQLAIDSLENALNTQLKHAEVSIETFDRSVRFGQGIAKAIFEWSKTDGGHEGFKRNFPADYKVPIYPGAWQPTENGIKIPMQPHWGQNRTFLMANTRLQPAEPIAFSTNIQSPYFQQYFEVYQKNISLSSEEKEIAVWWADDQSETFTPPGHSYQLAMLAIKQSKANLAKTAETLARVGMGVADAFVLCWRCKYMFNNERPYTFVRRAIDPTWMPFWPAPPFPGYSSGHATQSAATATVLTALYGDTFAFIDSSHVARGTDTARKVAFKARHFKSFWQAAEESAYSRFLGGIHTKQDNQAGLAEGKKIGENINALQWRK
jgi:hypothetical protein